MKLRVVLGTMTFGSQTNQPDATAQLAHFVGAGHAEIDTARMYNKGGTETMLGAIFGERADLRDAVRVASKANAFDGYDKVLTAASVARHTAVRRGRAAPCRSATSTTIKSSPTDRSVAIRTR